MDWYRIQHSLPGWDAVPGARRIFLDRLASSAIGSHDSGDLFTGILVVSIIYTIPINSVHLNHNLFRKFLQRISTLAPEQRPFGASLSRCVWEKAWQRSSIHSAIACFTRIRRSGDWKWQNGNASQFYSATGCCSEIIGHVQWDTRPLQYGEKCTDGHNLSL